MNLVRWIRSLIDRRRLEAEMAEEMQVHIEARTADLVARGMPREEALRVARIEFGSQDRYREEGREARGWAWVDVPAREARMAWRFLSRTPAFALIAVLTLAVGIGANAAVFSVLNSVLLKPLAYSDPDRIYTVRTVVGPDPALPGDSPVSGLLAARWRQACGSCESMSLLFPSGVNLGGAGAPERVDALSMSGPLFEMLGARMQLGRGFVPEEYKTGANNVIVISDTLWRQSFGADPGVISRKIVWNRTPMEIVGVLPAGFRLPRGEQAGAMVPFADRIDLFRPMNADTSYLGDPYNYAAFVKLRQGATAEQAETEMNRQAAQATRPMERGRARLTPLKEKMVDPVRGSIWMLSGAAAALLLIVCVNLGNLLLVRASGRQRDWAIRAAIGASRWQLVRQALRSRWHWLPWAQCWESPGHGPH